MIEHFLHSQNHRIKQTGLELLVGLPTDFKCRWIDSSLKAAPDIALRLIQQVESDMTVTEAHVKKWLEASPENNRTLIWNHLVTSRSSRWAPLLALQRHLKPFVAECVAANKPERAVRFMKAYHENQSQGFDQHDKVNLFSCIEQPIAKELIDWYFTLLGPKSTIPYKFLPARQVRVYLEILKNTPEAIQNGHASYMQELYTRIQDEEERALLATEIAMAKEASQLNKDALDAIFSMFIPMQTEEPEEQVVQEVQQEETLDLLECLDPKTMAENIDQIAATLKELETREDLLTKVEKGNLRGLLKPFMAAAKKHKCYSLAVRFVKVHQMHGCPSLDGSDLSDLRMCGGR